VAGLRLKSNLSALLEEWMADYEVAWNAQPKHDNSHILAPSRVRAILYEMTGASTAPLSAVLSGARLSSKKLLEMKCATEILWNDPRFRSRTRLLETLKDSANVPGSGRVLELVAQRANNEEQALVAAMGPLVAGELCTLLGGPDTAETVALNFDIPRADKPSVRQESDVIIWVKKENAHGLAPGLYLVENKYRFAETEKSKAFFKNRTVREQRQRHRQSALWLASRGFEVGGVITVVSGVDRPSLIEPISTNLQDVYRAIVHVDIEALSKGPPPEPFDVKTLQRFERQPRDIAIVLAEEHYGTLRRTGAPRELFLERGLKGASPQKPLPPPVPGTGGRTRLLAALKKATARIWDDPLFVPYGAFRAHLAGQWGVNGIGRVLVRAASGAPRESEINARIAIACAMPALIAALGGAQSAETIGYLTEAPSNPSHPTLTQQIDALLFVKRPPNGLSPGVYVVKSSHGRLDASGEVDPYHEDQWYDRYKTQRMNMDWLREQGYPVRGVIFTYDRRGHPSVIERSVRRNDVFEARLDYVTQGPGAATAPEEERLMDLAQHPRDADVLLRGWLSLHGARLSAQRAADALGILALAAASADDADRALADLASDEVRFFLFGRMRRSDDFGVLRTLTARLAAPDADADLQARTVQGLAAYTEFALHELQSQLDRHAAGSVNAAIAALRTAVRSQEYAPDARLEAAEASLSLGRLPGEPLDAALLRDLSKLVADLLAEVLNVHMPTRVAAESHYDPARTPKFLAHFLQALREDETALHSEETENVSVVFEHFMAFFIHDWQRDLTEFRKGHASVAVRTRLIASAGLLADPLVARSAALSPVFASRVPEMLTVTADAAGSPESADLREQALLTLGVVDAAFVEAMHSRWVNLHGKPPNTAKLERIIAYAEFSLV
jgi:hypothetical protein